MQRGASLLNTQTTLPNSKIVGYQSNQGSDQDPMQQHAVILEQPADLWILVVLGTSSNASFCSSINAYI